MKNRKGEWVKQSDVSYAFLARSYALYGLVFKNAETKEQWGWEARTHLSAHRNDLPFQGMAPTLSQAKKIVETLLIETDTVEPHDDYQV